MDWLIQGIAVLLVVALFVARLVSKASEGYEDEHGFHSGPRP